MHDLAVELLALLVYGPLVVLLHEGGHALFARAGGYRVTSFGVGLGRPLWSVALRRGTVIYLGRWLLAGGAATAIPTGPPTARRAWFNAGGLLAQAVLAVVLLALPQAWWIERMAAFNALVAVTNLVPWRLGAQASDGWYLLDAATGGRRGGGVLGQRAAFERMAEQEAAVGSRVGQIYSLVCLAWADLLAGRTSSASPLFRADPAETTLEPWIDGLYLYIRAEWHRMQGRPLAALRVAREGRHLERPSGEVESLLALAEARALVDLDAPDQAQRALARLAGVGGPMGAQATVVLLWASLCDDLGDRGDEDLELATWRVLRRQGEAWLDPADAVVALHHASDALEGRGRSLAARGARQAAATIARRTLEGAAKEDRTTLERRMGPALGLPPASLAR